MYIAKVHARVKHILRVNMQSFFISLFNIRNEGLEKQKNYEGPKQLNSLKLMKYCNIE